MRMWMVDPSLMCDKHLLGEHVECHMLAGTLARGRSIAGYMERDLLEPASLVDRHRALALEMTARGFRHRSPLETADDRYLPEATRRQRVDARAAADELARRCAACRGLLGRPGPVAPQGPESREQAP
jgi:hypothetical protein